MTPMRHWFPTIAVSLLATNLASGEIHDVSVDLSNGTFEPASISIAEGDLVRWTAVRQDVIFADSFATDLGWTAEATSETGQWTRRIPYPGCSELRGKVVKALDHDRWCMMTGAGWAECLDDVDAGSVALTSPEIELTSEAAFLSFAQWFSNSSGNNPFQNPMTTTVIIDGVEYPVETILDAPADTSGGWINRLYDLNDFATWKPGATLQIQFIVEDLTGAVVEAGIDRVVVSSSPSASRPSQRLRSAPRTEDSPAPSAPRHRPSSGPSATSTASVRSSSCSTVAARPPAWR